LRIGILELVLQRLSLALGKRLDESEGLKQRVVSTFLMIEMCRCSYVFTANGLNHIIRRCPEQFSNDGELVDVVLAGEKRLALEHLCKDTSCAPNVDLDVVFLPCKHDFWGSVVSG